VGSAFNSQPHIVKEVSATALRAKKIEICMRSQIAGEIITQANIDRMDRNGGHLLEH
jgi:hypothetical protein